MFIRIFFLFFFSGMCFFSAYCQDDGDNTGGIAIYDTICVDTYQLIATAPSSGQAGAWTFPSGIVISDPSDPRAMVSGMISSHTYSFIWLLEEEGEVVISDTIVLTYLATSMAEAGPNQCLTIPFPHLSGSVSLSGSPATMSEAVRWRVIESASLTPDSFANIDQSVTILHGITPGTHKIAYIITNPITGCQTGDTLQLTAVNEARTIQNDACLPLSPNQSDTTLILEGISPQGGAFSMWKNPGGLQSQLTSPHLSSTEVILSGHGEHLFRYYIQLDECVDSSGFSLTLITRAEAGNDTCMLKGNTLMLKNPALGPFEEHRWRSESENSPHNADSYYENIQLGTRTLFHEIWDRDQRCVSVDSMTVTGISGTLKIEDTCLVIDPGDLTAILTMNNLAFDPALETMTIYSIDGDSIISADGDVSFSMPAGSHRMMAILENIQTQCRITDTFIVTVINKAITGPDQCLADQPSPVSITANYNATASGETGTWYSARPLTFGSPYTPQTTVEGLTEGVYRVYWRINNGACADSSYLTLSLISPAEVAGDTCVHEDNAALNAVDVKGDHQSGHWSVLTGNGSITDISSSSTSVSGLDWDVHQFIWQISDTIGFCQSSDTMRVTRFSLPDAGEDQCVPIFHEEAEVSLSGNTPRPGESAFWSNADSSSIALSEPAITHLPLGIHKFFWSIERIAGACAAKDSVTIRVITASNAGATQCLTEPLASVNLTANQYSSSTGETGYWTSDQNAFFSSYNDPGAELSIPSPGAYTLWWHITNQSCRDSSKVTVSILSQPQTIPDICAHEHMTDTIRLSATSFNSEYQAGLWRSLNPATRIEDPASTTTAVQGLSLGLNRFYWQLTDTIGVCSSTDTLDINIVTTPEATTEPCHIADDNGKKTVSLLGNTFTNSLESGFWTMSAPGFSMDSLLINPKISLEPGQYSFAWNIRNTASTCSMADTINIVVVSKASIISDSKYPLCLSESETPIELRADSLWRSKGENGRWIEVTEGIPSGLVIGDPPDQVTQVEILRKGVHHVQWLVENNGCFSLDSIHLSYVSNAEAGPDQCVPYQNGPSTEIVLEAGPIADTTETGSWRILPGSSSFFSATIDAPHHSSTPVRGLLKGVDQYIWTVADINGDCSQSDTIQVALVTAPDAGHDLCRIAPTGESGVDIQLHGSSPNSENERGSWNFHTSDIFANPLHGHTTAFLPRGVHRLIWSLQNIHAPSCSISDTITVRVISQALAGESQCLSTPSVSAFLRSSGYASSTGETGAWHKATPTSTAIIEHPSESESKVGNLKPGTHQFKWLVSNDGCKDSSYTTVTLMTRPATGENQCLTYEEENTRVTLTANQASVSELSTWLPSSNSIAGVSLNPQGDICELTIFNKGSYTIYYRISDTANICSPLKDSVIVTVLSKPEIHTTECEVIPDGNHGKDISLATKSGLSGQEDASWSSIPPLNFNNPTSPATIASDVPSGTYRVYWTIRNRLDHSCSARDSSTIRLISKAQAGSDICIIKPVENTILQARPALTENGETGSWRLVSAPWQIQYDPNNPQSTVIRLPTGISTFRWYISNDNCKDSAEIKVSVQTKAFAGGDMAICGSQTTLNGVSPAPNETGAWSVPSGDAPTLEDNTAARSLVSDLKPGSNLLIWTISNTICSNSDTVNVMNNQPTIVNIATPDQESCFTANLLVGNKATKEIQTSGSFWKLIKEPSDNFPKTIINSPGSDSTIVRNLNAPGDYVFIYKIFNASCDTISDTVTISRGESLYNFAIGPTQACVDDTIQLSGQPIPVDGEGDWILSGGAGTFEDRFSHITKVYDLGVKQNLFYWRLKRGECQNFQSVIIEGFDKPSKAVIFNENSQLCETDTLTLRAEKPEVGICSWEIIQGFAELETPESHITRVKALAPGTTIFRWSCANGPCDTTSAEVLIERFVRETRAVAGKDTTLCGDAMTLEATLPQSGTGYWSVLSGSLDIDRPEYANTTAYNIAYGENILRWSVENGPCHSSDTLVIVAGEQVDKASAGDDLFLCEQSQVELYANTPVVGQGSWKALAGNELENPLASVTKVLHLPQDTSYYIWTIEKGFCRSTDTLTIYNYQAPSPAKAGKDMHIYSDETYLQANKVTIGKGEWRALNMEIQVDDPGNPMTMVRGIPPGSSSFVWTVSNGNCPLSSDTMEVIRDSFIIPNAFSPNGDGKNDTFEIKGLELFSPAKITIFNRWGEEIFNANDYKNDWDGTNMTGKALAADTYFYVLTLNNGRSYQGHILLKR